MEIFCLQKELEYILQNRTWLRHFHGCFTRTRTGSARDIDVESKAESGFGASEHPPCLHCGRTNPPERSWIKHPHKRPKKKTGKLPKKKGYKKDSDKSESAGATMHQVYSVMARAGPEEWVLDSGASAHMTGIKS